MTKTMLEVCDLMRERFTSGNSVPVERAYIRRDEWDAILKSLPGEPITAEDCALLCGKAMYGPCLLDNCPRRTAVEPSVCPHGFFKGYCGDPACIPFNAALS